MSIVMYYSETQYQADINVLLPFWQWKMKGVRQERFNCMSDYFIVIQIEWPTKPNPQSSWHIDMHSGL